ncbi:MAG: hypothetical protein RI897_4323 [Verrucomicrobiota bacterium]
MASSCPLGLHFTAWAEPGRSSGVGWTGSWSNQGSGGADAATSQTLVGCQSSSKTSAAKPFFSSSFCSLGVSALVRKAICEPSGFQS